MADKVKLVIEIPKDIYARCKEYKLWSYDAETLEGAVATSKPLSEVLGEIKAEIKEKCDSIDDIARANIYQYAPHREIQDLLCEILTSIDKAESEVKPNDDNNPQS